MISFLLRLLGLDDANRLSVADFVAHRDPKAPVLDVRTPGEFAQGHLAGAINVDVMAADFEDRLDALDAAGRLSSEAPVYLYCRSGSRSGRAAAILRRRGYEEAFNIGGFQALKRAGVEVDR